MYKGLLVESARLKK